MHPASPQFPNRAARRHPEQYLRAQQAAAYLGISVATLWRWAQVRPDEFPKPVRLGPRVTCWSVSALEDFVSRQQEAA